MLGDGVSTFRDKRTRQDRTLSVTLQTDCRSHAHPPTHPSSHASLHLPIDPSIHPPIHTATTYPSIHCSVHPPVHPSIQPSTHWSIGLSTHLSTHAFTYHSTLLLKHTRHSPPLLWGRGLPQQEISQPPLEQDTQPVNLLIKQILEELTELSLPGGPMRFPQSFSLKMEEGLSH